MTEQEINEGARETTLKNVKQGDFFRLKPGGKVYVRDEYNRSTKKYEYFDFDDVNNFHEAKCERKVIVDFCF